MPAESSVLAGRPRADSGLRVLDHGPHTVHPQIRPSLLHGRGRRSEFNEAAAPDYRDFAYLSFTIGMTFQVSDTNIESKQIRRTVLRHAWISFPMGVVIIATTINLVAGLAR